MLFGIVNGLATFQGYINLVSKEYPDILCIAYLDDILIYSVNSQTHAKDVRKVLHQILKNCLYFKFEKYVFIVEEIRFLTFVYTTQQVKLELSCIDIFQE